MGPDPSSAHASMLTPPKLTGETDKYQWRTDVKTWAQVVKLYAKGGENRAKGMLNALGLTLYLSLQRDQRNIIDNAAHSQGVTLNLYEDTEQENLTDTAKVQFKLVEKIVQLVAKDSPTDGIRRLVRVSQDIHQCIRGKNEKPHIFARKFQGAAKQYLNMCSAAQGATESQNFAILLLENAKLQSATFNNIVTQLITKSAARNDSASTARVNILDKTFETLLDQSKATTEAITTWESFNGTTVQNHQLHVLLDQTKNMAMTMRITAEDAQKLWESLKDTDRPSYAIALDDAVEALCDIKADEDTPEHKKKSEGEAEKKGAMMTKRKDRDETTQQPQRKRLTSYIPPGTGKKKDSKCVACGKMGHWKGDFVCEEHPMHQQWLANKEGKKVSFENDPTASKKSNSYFQERVRSRSRPTPTPSLMKEPPPPLEVSITRPHYATPLASRPYWIHPANKMSTAGDKSVMMRAPSSRHGR